MKDCGFCLYEDNPDCDICDLPEFTDELYRDTCDMCHEFIMIPYDARDQFNLIVCTHCSHEPYDGDDLGYEVGTYEGVFVEGSDTWWRNTCLL